MYRRSLGRPGWAIPNRSEDGISDKSARVESPRATGLSSVAFASGVMETHLLIGERNISLQSHRILTFPNRSGNGVSDKSARVQRPRAGGLCTYAFTHVPMKLGIDWRAEYYTMLAEWSSQTEATHLLTGERNISPQSHRIKILLTNARNKIPFSPFTFL